MAQKSILTVINDEDDFRIVEIVLSRAGFDLIKAENCDNLLNTILTEKPDLILMDQYEFDKGGGYEVLQELKTLQVPSRVIIKCYWFFNHTSDIRKFMEIGVYDYISFPFVISTLVESVKNALMVDPISAGTPSPIVEKLLVYIEKLQQEKEKLWEGYQWYEKNRQRLACDCQQQLGDGTGSYRKPKSTAFRKLGRVSDGYYIGYKFVCEVCGTSWFCGESHTHSEFSYFWEPANENIELVQLDDNCYPEEPEDYEPG